MRGVRHRVPVRAEAGRLSAGSGGSDAHAWLVDQGPWRPRSISFGSAAESRVADMATPSPASRSGPFPEESGPFPGDGRQRVCPHCLSGALMALGRILADITGIRIEYQCRDCAKEFMLLR